MSVKVSSIIDNQFPEFMRIESPLLVDFIKQYYISGEYSGAPFDLISNLANYTKLENLTHLVESTILSADISFSDNVINVESTNGFPDSYGLLKIDSEIITYTSKTETSFVDCVRGFSGISNSELEFSTSESDSHLSGAVVENLSIIFLSKFLEKLKKQYIPGFEGREINSNVNQTLFIERSKDFYASKGTEKSFEILFGALYGEKVKVIEPRDYLFTPSAAEYRVTKDLVVEALIGDPMLLENRTLFQDQTDQYPRASGSISKVEKITRNDVDYYIISLDYDFNKDIDVEGSIFGEFSIHPKTKITSNVSAGASAISVDSTVGFPASGYLVLDDSSLIQYTSKSLTQFFGCSGIIVDLEAGQSVKVNAFAYGYSGSDKTEIVAVRVTGVIGDFQEVNKAYNLVVGDSIRPETLGKLSTSVQSKNWIYNLPISYLVKGITLIDTVASKYQFETFDDNIFAVGDSLNIVLTNGTIITTNVYAKVNSTNFIVQGQGSLSISTIDHVEKIISQVSSNNYDELEIYSANVQNVYEDANENVFVASPSLPFYFQQPLEVSSRGVVLSGTFSGEVLNYSNHGFLTGDIVLYDYPSTDSNLGISKGTYYIKKINDNSFSLATSRSNLRAGIYLSVSGTVQSNTLVYENFAGKSLTNQKIIRKISKPVDSKIIENTPIGNIGIFVNGVELLNYKSQNSVFYGPIESVDVLSPGEGYDIITPPLVEIVDESGSGAKVNPEINGSLKEIRLIDSNLIVSGEPTITITGGNGVGARAKAEIGLFDHSAIFTTDNISSNVIGFATYHNFSNHEKVLFEPGGISKVTGITTNSEYYVSNVSPLEVKLYKTYDDSISDSNAINLSVTGFGIHKLVSSEPKPKISSIIVTNSGEGYTNRRISITSSGINTATDTINFTGHGFKTGELIVYESYSDSPIVGLQTNVSYYVTKLDENNFKLSQVATVGIETSKDFYLNTQQFIDFSSSGSGKHYFNYEPISVNVIGDIKNYYVSPNAGIASTTTSLSPLFSLYITEADLKTFIGGPYVLGYGVALQYEQKVTAVGIYAPTITDHKVGIWWVSQPGFSGLETATLLWQGMLPAGAGTTFDNFRWFNIDGPLLQPGVYVIGATWDESLIPAALTPGQVDLLVSGTIMGTPEVYGAVNTDPGVVPQLDVDLSDPLYTPIGISPGFNLGFISANISLVSPDSIPPVEPSTVTTVFNFASANIQPIFRGKINSIFVEDGGQNYGQEDIINYNRQPNISINSGKDAEIRAIVSNGKISEVLIINSGSGYNSPPDIIISGTGNGAKLTPIIVNGELSKVNIINPGYGYEQKNISLTVVASGSNGVLRTNTKSWTINWIERLIQTNQIVNDDGIITRGTRSDLGLEYAHGYAPRKLRQMLQSSKYVANTLTYRPDLVLDSYNKETISDSHSPIIGWAYDGNPIYGPYGYEYKTSGTIKLLQSGYELSLKQNRPSVTLYPAGIFVEDYTFTNSGDLDEHNGRYCITPDFPNGTYAYFASVSNQGAEISGPFKNYFRPVFPYLIGQSYKSKPIDFNFDYYSNQDSIEINQTGWLRNTTPFNLTAETSYYEYVVKPFDYSDQSTIVTSINSGSVENIEIIDGGKNYKVGDKLVFSNASTGGANASAEVLQIKGKSISSLVLDGTTIFDVEFIPDSKYGTIGFSTLPHNLLDNDIVSIKNLSYNRKSLQNTFTVKVPSETYVLSKDIASTGVSGINTYFELYGNLKFPTIRENDVLQIDDEQVKVLTIDTLTSRIFVEREFNSTVGAYHTSGALLTEVPRKFYIKKSFPDFTNSDYNRELYFNPSETIGFGTGIGNTILFSSPGAGRTSIFVPSKSIYIQNHGLKTGEELLYSANNGSPLIVSVNGVSTSILSNNTTVYAVNYSTDFIGISTQKVAIGSSGTFIGYNTTSPAQIVYFIDKGNGKAHSLKTNYNSTVGEVNKNLVNVFVDSDPELKVDDTVYVTATPTGITDVKITYNAYNQRLLVNPKSFVSGDVDLVNNTITIPNHNLFTGEKVVYTSSSPLSGLTNNGIYYVVVINSDKIGLSQSFYNATLDTPIRIDFTSSSFGTISQVNPGLRIVKNNTVKFDLSDSSLSVVGGADVIPGFEFNLFTDNKFLNNFESTFSSGSFNVVKTGKIGVDSTASVTLTYDSNIPDSLYYNLTPIDSKSFVTDTENIVNYNKIIFVDSYYSGQHKITGIGTTAFSYVVTERPEVSSYSKNVSYVTRSKNAYDTIDKIVVTSGGINYKSLPGISSIITEKGENAILEARSTTIGQIKNYVTNDIGFDYPGDLSLSPTTLAPVILKVLPKTSLKTIGISSEGVNYIFAPDLILLDGLSEKPIENVDLRYQLGDKFVSIYRNSKSISNITPLLIPINNSNAIEISSITFDSVTKDVNIVLSTSYSSIEEFPFTTNDKVLLENICIFADADAKGYNSSDYDYVRFQIIGVTPNIGGANPSITINFSSVLAEGEYPGTYDFNILSGSVLPEKFFPQFIIELEENSFLKGENISEADHIGKVQNWNNDNKLLTVSTSDSFTAGNVVIGSDSQSEATITNIYDFNSQYKIKSSAIVRKGWNTEKGFLDNEFQRIQDSDYYQSFAYSLKSKVDYSTWNSPVSSLAHISGFKKFGDLVVESDTDSGISSIQNLSSADLIIYSESEVDLNCIEDYDLVAENNYLTGNNVTSNEIYFSSRILADYSEAVGNRVLVLDDISSKFDGTTKKFALTAKNDSAFRKVFNGASTGVVNVQTNRLILGNHYFSNGEKVQYSHNGSPIGIQTVNISGIGTTSLLPSTVYVIKHSESAISLAGTAENALKEVPVPLVFTAVGIGSSHVLTSINQNSKAIISLGGIIQSPLVSTGITNVCKSYVGIGSTIVSFNSINNFVSGDYFKIDSETFKIISIGVSSTTDVLVQRGWAGTGISTHNYNSLIVKLQGNYNIVDSDVHFVEPPLGPTPIGIATGPSDSVDYVGITTVLNFNGRVFTKNGVKDTVYDAYYSNYVFDDISSGFNGISTVFTLKSNDQNVSNIADNNALLLLNETFQVPSDFSGIVKTYGSYTLGESTGITSVRFLGSPVTTANDPNAAGVPLGGVIVSIGYSQGFGLQPLVAAGATAVVSAAGTIRSISIGNSGSGYRSGYQTVNVGVYVSTTGITTVNYVGVASILNGNVVSVSITNPGAGYTFTNPPKVKIDDPLPYFNIPLVYSSPSSGIGTGASANITVGLGSSITEIQIQNKGYGYKKGDVLTLNGSTVGIPTFTTGGYSKPLILVDEIYNHKFAGWSFGQLQIIDPISNLFNGTRKSFPIKIDKVLRSIRPRAGSSIDIKNTLLIFINGILQVPGESYEFTGSTFITFNEAPKAEDDCVILFYRGSGDTDVIDVEVTQTIKPGDTVKISEDSGLKENERLVSLLNSSDSLITIPYTGPGISLDETYYRPIKWCRQTEDLFINQQPVPKNREIYEPLVELSTNIIKSVGVSTTILFVESARAFIESDSVKNYLRIISQDERSPAIASLAVTTGGSIGTITILDPGKGYTSVPNVTISSPIGLSTSYGAYASATISNGQVSNIILTSPGTGYTSSPSPQIIIDAPAPVFEDNSTSSTEGDFGVIVGISQTSVGVASTGLVFNLFIPPDSYLRDTAVVGSATTISTIQTGYYFVVKNSFVGAGITTLDENGAVIFNGSEYLNAVYRVANVSIAKTAVTGIGETYVSKVTVSVVNNNISGIGVTNVYGDFSWGKITLPRRKTSNTFTLYNNSLAGINSSALVKTIRPSL